MSKITLAWNISNPIVFTVKMDLDSCRKLKDISYAMRPSYWEDESPSNHQRRIDLDVVYIGKSTV